MERGLGLKINEKDNTAVVFTDDSQKNKKLKIKDSIGRVEEIKLLSDIPYGHKVAVEDIKSGEEIFKYGIAIGVATKNILKGEHVHIHNLDSQRSRGDK